MSKSNLNKKKLVRNNQNFAKQWLFEVWEISPLFCFFQNCWEIEIVRNIYFEMFSFHFQKSCLICKIQNVYNCNDLSVRIYSKNLPQEFAFKTFDQLFSQQWHQSLKLIITTLRVVTNVGWRKLVLMIYHIHFHYPVDHSA